MQQGKQLCPNLQELEMTKRLAIVGAGGHGKVVADLAELLGWSDVHFFDDGYPSKQMLEHWRIVGDFKHLSNIHQQYDGVIVAIGNNTVRLAMLEQLQKCGAKLVSLIHPQAFVSKSAEVGAGVVVFANATVNAFAQLGLGVIVNVNASVDHDCILGDAVHVCPGVNLAGGIRVGTKSWIGIGSCIIQQVIIEENVMIGAGSVVIRNVPAGMVMVGNPAKPLVK